MTPWSGLCRRSWHLRVLFAFVAVLTFVVVAWSSASAFASIAGNQPDPNDQTIASNAQSAESSVDPANNGGVSEDTATDEAGQADASTDTSTADTDSDTLTSEAAEDEQTTIPTYQLTVSVFRCDHPSFDPYFSSNAQMVIDQCVTPGSGSFAVTTTMPVEPQSGGALTFQIGPDLALQEQLMPGYDNPIANCFIFDANGNVADQIGPGEANGGFWKVGGVAGNVHCDWYQVDRGVGVVYIVNMACPNPLAFPKPDLNQLVAICTAPAGPIDFGVQYGQVYTKIGKTGGEFNDVLFEGITTGPIAIWAEPPATFESARMFCQVNTIEGVEISPFAEVPVSAFRATGLTLGHDQRLHCSWFNIPGSPGVLDTGSPPTPTPRPGVADVPENGGVLDAGSSTGPPDPVASELRIRLATCPTGYDPFAPEADPNLDCTPGPNGVTFMLADDDPDTPDRESTTGDATDSLATFDGLAAGEYTVTETVPPGTGTMFVLGCAGGGIDPIPAIVDGSLAISVTSGVIMTCPWFNVPSGDTPLQVASEGTPAVAAAITGTASLTVYTYNCPAGFDVATIDANPVSSCTPAANMSLDIDDTIDDSAGRYIETDASGTGTIDNLPAGTYFIDQSVRNGTTATFVWDCYDIAGASSRTDPLVTGSSLTYDLAEGANIRCDWFNVTGGMGRVIVNSHACGYLVPSYTLALYQLAVQCTDDPGTVDYTVVSDTHQETQPASKSPLMLASFANVPSGYVAVVEKLLPGWGTPIVYCQVSLEDATLVSPPTLNDVVVGRQISFQLEPGQVVYCDWYNVAQGNVDIVVTKHACPSGFDAYSADETALGLNCQEDPGSVDFTAEDGALYFQTRTATGTTTATFEDVPSGEVRITEKLPAGYGLPLVYCRVDFENGTNVLPIARVPVVGGEGPSIVRQLSAGQVLRCDWVNVPGGLGKVSVWKQSCPVGFDAEHASRLELDQGCQEDIHDIEFSLTSGSFSDTATSTNLFRYADFPGVPAGPLTVTESLPPGFGTPVVYCRVQQPTQQTTPPERVVVAGDTTINWQLEADQWLICEWYNVPETDSTVTVIKWMCPKDTPTDRDHDFYATACTEAHADVSFTLTHSEGTAQGTTDGNGQIQWTDVPLGAIGIQETIPKDYIEPVVFCSASTAATLAVLNRMESSGGYVEDQLTDARTTYTCHWFNIFGGPGEITVHKYTCPPGYDLHAAGADPRVDCTTATNGVVFTLTDGDSSTSDSQSMTGDSVDGAVHFGSLEPGSYTVTESLPPGTASVFVLDCTGGKMGAIRPYPLSTDEMLDVTVGAGESIDCSWYNVPKLERGQLTVRKYACSTQLFESDLDCETFEDGQVFDLVMWDGDSWGYHSSGTTDGVGQYTWSDLEPGQYWLDEPDADWCHLASDRLSDNGNWLNVADGDTTLVSIYNCGVGTPGTPGETPGKYPNTGVGPTGSVPGSPARWPAFAPLAGLIAMFCRRRNRDCGRHHPVAVDLVSTFQCEFVNLAFGGHKVRRYRNLKCLSKFASRGQGDGLQPSTTISRRQLAAVICLPLAASLPLSRAVLARIDQENPIGAGIPITGTPVSLCLPATPSPGATPETLTCIRGAVPATLRIDAIGVDAPVEVLETVGGEMQQPSDDEHVAWYKETARLGETGNILMAGHLNWWGVPEAVFFNLGALRAGDEVLVLDGDDEAYAFTVEWVRQESSLEPPGEEILGMTTNQALTLITCGGEWDSSINEYRERTVVRATRTDV